MAIALFVSLVLAAGITMLGEEWNWFVEGHRIGNNPMSYRADRLFWAKHRFELFTAALMIFWLALIHAARRIRLKHFSERTLRGPRPFWPLLIQCNWDLQQLRLELRFNVGNLFFKFRQLITNAIDRIGGYVVWLFQMGTHPLGCVPGFLDCIMPKLNLAKKQGIFCCRTEPKGGRELCTYRL
jgi:hypothetical protein